SPRARTSRPNDRDELEGAAPIGGTRKGTAMSETTSTVREEFERATSAELKESDIAKDRAIVGRDWPSRTQEYFSTATPENIRNFAHSYGDDNPLFCDPDYGRRTRWGGQIAPPIMVGILNAPLCGEQPSK